MSRLILASAVLTLLLPGAARAQGPSYRDTVRDLVDGTVRGMSLSAFVAEQHEKALATWKRAFSTDAPGHHETAHLLVYGKVAGRTLSDVGAALEKQYVLAAKTLAMIHEEPWSGKVAIYLAPDRPAYVSFIRVVEQRKIEEGETGSFLLDDEKPFVVAGPPLAKIDLAVEGTAGAQLAAALLMRKGGVKVPTWVLEGFGRATVLRSGPASVLTAEHKRAYTYVVKNKRTVKDVINSPLADDEATILRANLMEYLAYGGGSTRFLKLVMGFRPSDTVAEPTFDTALKVAEISPERLDQVWQGWVKSLK